MTIETKRRVAKGLQLGLVVGVLVGLSGLIQTAWLADPIPALAQTVTVDSTQSPLVVNALADLANLTPTDGQSVIIKTGTEKGLWYYDKDSVAVVDSVAVLTGPGSVGRFLVINNDAGSVAAATAITAAQIDNDVDLEFGVFDADSPRSLTLAELKKTGVQVVNVKQYGATGDGVADDTAEIQAAIDAADSGAVGIVFIPAGLYKVSAAITIPSGVHIKGAGTYATFIQLDGTDFYAFTSAGTAAWTLSDMTIWTPAGTTRNGKGLKLSTGGNNASLLVERVRFHLLLHAVESTHYVTHVEFRNCEFAYCTDPAFYVNTGSVVNNLVFTACRFEETYDAHFEQISTVTGSSIRFNNCIIESSRGQYAIDLGAHPYDVVFNASHFENNGHGGSVSDTADVRVINGSGSVNFISCNFSTPSTGTSNHYNVRGTSDPAASLTFIGNTFASANVGNAADYTGVAYWRRNSRVTSIGNFYTYEPFNYYPQAETRVACISERPFGSTAYSAGPIVRSVTTTDATPTTIFQWDYLSSGADKHSLMFTSNVTCVSEDGTVYAAYKRSVFINRNDTTTTNTLVGILSDSEHESEAGLDVAWSVAAGSEGTAVLTVTGKAATNMRWVADVSVINAGY